jgi:hypothetical protein
MTNHGYSLTGMSSCAGAVTEVVQRYPCLKSCSFMHAAMQPYGHRARFCLAMLDCHRHRMTRTGTLLCISVASFKYMPLNSYRKVMVTDRMENTNVPGPDHEGAALIMGNSVPTWHRHYWNGKRTHLAAEAAAATQVYRQETLARRQDAARVDHYMLVVDAGLHSRCQACRSCRLQIQTCHSCLRMVSEVWGQLTVRCDVWGAIFVQANLLPFISHSQRRQLRPTL